MRDFARGERMTAAEATPELGIAADRNDRAFLGHPKGFQSALG